VWKPYYQALRAREFSVIQALVIFYALPSRFGNKRMCGSMLRKLAASTMQLDENHRILEVPKNPDWKSD